MNVVTKQEADQYLANLVEGGLPAGGVPDDLIQDVSSRLARYCGRADWGGSETRTEYFDGGSMHIAVSVWPITSVTAIKDDTDHEWADDTLIDAEDYWISQKNDGMIHFESFQTIEDNQNVQVTYVGGYASEASVPSAIKRAALLQIEYEVKRRLPGRYQSVPGEYTEQAFNSDGIGLLGESRSLVEPFKRRIIFA